MDIKAILAEAAILIDDDWGNEEYQRGIVELICYLMGWNGDDTEVVIEMIKATQNYQ